jgi:arylsulfatase A-like enzyme
LTGQYSARSGVWHTIGGRSLLQKDKTTMANVFQSSGYRTGIFGKWHLGDNYPFRPQDRGFDETLVHRSGSIGNRWDYWGNDYYDDTYFRNGKPEKFEGYCNTIWFDEAIQFIKRNKKRPFFCFLSTNIPHAPLHVENKYFEPYRSQVSDRLAKYYGMVTKFDEDLGMLRKELKVLGLEENTILIFMTDNGPCPWFGGIKIDNEGFIEEGYSGGMRGGKIWGYENAHRVPCFIRWSAGGIEGGKDIGNLTAHFDLLPTLIDCCGLKSPDKVKFDGFSLMSLLKNQKRKYPERTIFVHNQRNDFPVKYKEYEVLTERWRLIHPYKKEIEDMQGFNSGKPSGEIRYINDPDLYELYDIIQDPGQRKNIASQYPEIVRELSRKYEEWWEDISSDFDKYCETIVGSDFENPTILYSHDAHRIGRDNIWVIYVQKDGKYVIKLSRWPQESNKRLSENRSGEKTIRMKKAGLKLGNIDTSMEVTSEMKSAEFIVNVKSGTTCMQGWFTEHQTNRKIQADFAYIERLRPADLVSIEEYQASEPNRLLKR